MSVWLPNVERIAGNSGGAMDGDGSRKLLLHTTEGATIAGAVAAYRTNNSWPTLTVDCNQRRVVEHLPLEVAARSLRNETGGVQTNREGTVLVQIELVGFAGNPATVGSAADLAWLGAELVGPICRLMDIPVRSTVTWVAYPASYGVGASQRLSAAAWDGYSGVLGHQHAPENSHGDPGLLDIALILAAASPQEDDLTPEEHDWLRQIATSVVPLIQDSKPADGRFQVQTLVKRAIDDRTDEIAKASATAVKPLIPTAETVADAVVAKLPTSSGGGVTREEVAAAIREVFAEVRYTTAPADIP